MAITAYERGHKIFYDFEDKVWKYEDTKERTDEKRACKRCGKEPTKEGYDACKGYVGGATSVCCGHGVESPIEM